MAFVNPQRVAYTRVVIWFGVCAGEEMVALHVLRLFGHKKLVVPRSGEDPMKQWLARLGLAT